MVEEGGFEPPKSLTTDLQSARFGHSGTPPYSKNAGAGGRTRTPDLLITNQLLYQLSYTSKLPAAIIITNHFLFVNIFFNFLRKRGFAMNLEELSLQYRETGERCRRLLAAQRKELAREDITEAQRQLIRRRITMLTAMLRENIELAIRLEKYYGGNGS